MPFIRNEAHESFFLLSERRIRSAVANEHSSSIDARRRLIKEHILLSESGVASTRPPLHIPTSLDQFFDLGLEDSSLYDSDQVVYRHQLKHQGRPSILVVDQLWLWANSGTDGSTLQVN